jgi:patatin-like phospholipase/acyl hydrolase
MILKNLMEVINPRNPPSPCEYFDMIGGTSTGGLIALMLGRLRMSVDECIDVYETMSKEVFSKTHRFPVQTLHPRQTQGRFDHGALERHVKLLLERRGLHPDTLFDDELEEGSCKTYVCVMPHLVNVRTLN